MCWVALSLTACAGVASRRATRSALDELTSPEARRQVAALLTDPQVSAATQALSRDITGALLDEVTEEERAARIGDALEQYATRLSRVVSAAIATQLVDVAPELMRGVLEAAASEQGRERLEAVGEALADGLGSELTRGVLRAASAERGRAQLATIGGALAQGVGVELAASLRSDLGPALRETLRRDVAVGLAEVLESERFDAALGRAARTLGREAVLGAEDALLEIRARPESALGRLGETAEAGTALLERLSAALGIGAALLLAGLIWSLVRQRRMRAESRHREAALLLLASIIKVAQDKPWATELRDLLREQIRDQPGALELRRLLAEHLELRMRPEPPSREPVPT